MASLRRSRPPVCRPRIGSRGGKKRLKALAEWHFGDEGQEYCAACKVQCEACPYTENAPQTADGISAWAVIRACGAQVRFGKNAPYGLDYASVLMMADAMGAKSALLAESLPVVEAIMMGAYQAKAQQDA